MDIGCALMGGSFMPEYKGGSLTKETAFDRLVSGYSLALDMGYDYIEASCGEILSLSENEIEKLLELKKSGDFNLRYLNSFVRGDLKICTEKRNTLEDYAKEVIRRATKLGIEIIIFGSGVARHCPDSMPISEGYEKFISFIEICDLIAKEYNVKIALEPLNHTETNILNTVFEGARLVREINSPQIVLLADAFHMSIEGEDAKVILDNKDIICHLHVSEAPGRVFPGKFGGEYLIELGKELLCSGFDKDMSVECVFDDFEKEGHIAFQFIKEKMICLN